MKSILFKIFVTYILMLLFISSALATETMTVDPQHTYILWHIKHLGFSTQAGKWYASGTLIIDKDQPQNSKVKISIQIANVVTGLPELDKHLMGKLFFDVKKYPTATFISDKINLITNETANMRGMLTLHGVTKPIDLAVKLNQVGSNPLTNKMTAGFSATTKIKRSDFNIKTLLPALSDEVDINIEVEAFKN